MIRLIDTHAHIHDREFGHDVDAVISRAQGAGVAVIVTLGTNLESSRRAVALAHRSPVVVAAAGVHPHDAASASEAELVAIEELARDDRVAMVGETGLDFYRNLSPREDQVRVLRQQLAIARKLDKPVAVHTREAHAEMLPILREHAALIADARPRVHPQRPLGVMHYFTGDPELARRYVELGFVISIHTSVTHKKANDLRAVARDIALKDLVIETDSPYGAPQAYRGRRNEPAHVVDAAKAVASVRGTTFEEVAAATTATALLLLRTVVPAKPALTG